MEITPEIQELLDAQKATLKSEFDAETSGLKTKVDELLGEKRAAKSKADEAQALADQEALDKAKANKDIETLTASYEAKLKERDDQIGGMLAENLSKTKSQIASDFLAQYGTGSQLALDAMKREYEQRIDIRDGKTVVLDAGGNLTALSIEDLNKEFVANSRYSDNIKGTQATGGGANGNKGGGGAVMKKPNEMNSTERLAFKNADPEGFKKAFNLN